MKVNVPVDAKPGIWSKLAHFERKAVAKLAMYAHLSYYALVSVEAHGSYRYAAGAVLGIMVLEWVHGEGVA